MPRKSRSKPSLTPTPAPPQDSQFLVNNHMVCFAFRYALGRRTGAVGIVVDHLKKLWPKLNWFDRNQIKKEIARAIERNDAGSVCDIREWQKVLTFDHGKPPWQYE